MKADKNFRERTTEALDERVGEDWKNYAFDLLLQSVHSVAALDSDPTGDALYVGTEILINIYRIEKNKIERAETQKLQAIIDGLKNNAK